MQAEATADTNDSLQFARQIDQAIGLLETPLMKEEHYVLSKM